MPTDVFISYSTRDTDTAQLLCSTLESAGVSCWIAPRNILPGQTWSESIIDGINGCQVMVLLYTSASNASPQVLREVERAVSKRLGILAFRAENVAPSKAMEYLISVSHWQEAYSGEIEEHLKLLVPSVQSLLALRRGGEPPVPSAPAFTPPPEVAAAPAPLNNLPRLLTSFVGREQQIKEVQELLSGSRLLTLVGAGGVGKTRLSLKVAEAVLPDYPEGVFQVELASLSDGSLVLQTVAQVLGIKEQAGQTIEQTLADALKDRCLLLLLDNCEHLLDACAQLSASLLRSCSHLRLLATSREALGIAGEQIYRVPSLSLPAPDAVPSAAALSQYEAALLFMDRALLCRPDFAVTDQNAPALASLCSQLDGIPLAIELAAARARAMTIEEIHDRLDNRFRLLTSGDRTALPRHRTLSAMLDWSYDLLDDSEKTLLNRLSVFAGGWTLEAAEKVCAGEGIEDWEVLDLLLSLSDKSLVVYEEQKGEGRYRLLETVDEYAEEKLASSGEQQRLQQKHQAYYLALAEEAAAQMRGSLQSALLRRLETEHDNLRAALEAEDKEASLRIAGALRWFWAIRGYLSEGRSRLAAALEQAGGSGDPMNRAKALQGMGMLAWIQSDFAAARTQFEVSAKLFLELGERQGAATSIMNLGLVFMNQGNYVVAKTQFEESLAIAREVGDKRGEASSIHNLGIIAFNQGDYAAARTLYEEGLAIFRELGDKRGIAYSLIGLGTVINNQGDYAAVRTLYEESLTLFRELGDKHGVATSIQNLGLIALNQGNYADAQPRFKECLMLFRELGEKQGIANALINIGNIRYGQSDYAAARTLYEECLALFRELGDKKGLANTLIDLGLVFMNQGDYAAAQTQFEESLMLTRELGARRGIANAISNLGMLAIKQGDFMSARARSEECLAIYQELGDKRGIAYAFEIFATLASARKQAERTTKMWTAAQRLRQELGTPLPQNDQDDIDRDLENARQALGEEAFSKARAEGSAMTLEQSVAYALEPTLSD